MANNNTNIRHRHRWATESNRKGDITIDTFAFSEEFCNGPVCVSCGKSFCEHHASNANKDFLKAFNDMTCPYDNGLDDKPYTDNDF